MTVVNATGFPLEVVRTLVELLRLRLRQAQQLRDLGGLLPFESSPSCAARLWRRRVGGRRPSQRAATGPHYSFPL